MGSSEFCTATVHILLRAKFSAMDYTLNIVNKWFLYLNIRRLQTGPGKFFMGSWKSPWFLSVKASEPCVCISAQCENNLGNFVGAILCSQHGVLWRDRLNMFAARFWEWTWGKSSCQVWDADPDGRCVPLNCYSVLISDLPSLLS